MGNEVSTQPVLQNTVADEDLGISYNSESDDGHVPLQSIFLPRSEAPKRRRSRTPRRSIMGKIPHEDDGSYSSRESSMQMGSSSRSRKNEDKMNTVMVGRFLEEYMEEMMLADEAKARIRRLPLQEKLMIIQQAVGEENEEDASAQHWGEKLHSFATARDIPDSIDDQKFGEFMYAFKARLTSVNTSWLDEFRAAGGTEDMIHVSEMALNRESGPKQLITILNCWEMLIDATFIKQIDSNQFCPMLLGWVEKSFELQQVDQSGQHDSYFLFQRGVVRLLTVLMWETNLEKNIKLLEHREPFFIALLKNTVPLSRHSIAFANDILVLINTVLNYMQDLEARVLFRSGFEKAGIFEAFHHIQSAKDTVPSNSDQEDDEGSHSGDGASDSRQTPKSGFEALEQQMDVFLQSSNKDQMHTNYKHVDLSSTSQVFEALYHRLKAESQDQHLRTLLQTLLVLPSGSTSWQNVLQSVAKAAARSNVSVSVSMDPDARPPKELNELVVDATREKALAKDLVGQVVGLKELLKVSEKDVQLANSKYDHAQEQLQSKAAEVAALANEIKALKEQVKNLHKQTLESDTASDTSDNSAMPTVHRQRSRSRSRSRSGSKNKTLRRKMSRKQSNIEPIEEQKEKQLPATVSAPAAAAPPPSVAPPPVAPPTSVAPTPAPAAPAAPTAPTAPAAPGAPPPPAAVSKKPKLQLRRIHWGKLKETQVQDTIWNDLTPERTGLDLEVDEEELLQHFCVTKKEAKKPKVDAKPRKKKPEKVYLLEEKRTRQIDLALYKFKVQPHELRAYIVSADDSLDLEAVTQLENCVPTKEEIDKVNGYTGDRKMLGNAEKLFLTLGTIPDLAARLDCWVFKLRFPDMYKDISQQLDVVQNTVEEVTTSKGLYAVLKALLLAGNFMNQGTSNGDASGFRLGSLSKMIITKSVDNKISLLDYIVDWIERKAESEPTSPSKMLVEQVEPLLSKAVTVLQQPLEAAILELTSKLDMLGKVGMALAPMENENDALPKKLIDFYGKHKQEADDCAHRLRMIRTSAINMSKSFAEPVHTVDSYIWDDFFQTLHSFIKSYIDAYEKRKKKMETEQKKAAREKQKRKSMMRKNDIQIMSEAPEKAAAVTEEESRELEMVVGTLRRKKQIAKERQAKSHVATTFSSLETADKTDVLDMIRKRREQRNSIFAKKPDVK